MPEGCEFKFDVTQSHISPKPDNELRQKEYAEKILHDDENGICSEEHILTMTTWDPMGPHGTPWGKSIQK